MWRTTARAPLLAVVVLFSTSTLAASSATPLPIRFGSTPATSQIKSLFGVTKVLTQVHPHQGQWLLAGLTTPRGYVPELVLAGAVHNRSGWHVRLLNRYVTSFEAAPDPCEQQTSSSLVPKETVIVVGCFDGGSNAFSFVTVVGFSPVVDLPQVMFALSCGPTHWSVDGPRLVIHPSGSQDLTFTYGDGGQIADHFELDRKDGNLPSSCRYLETGDFG